MATIDENHLLSNFFEQYLNVLGLSSVIFEDKDYLHEYYHAHFLQPQLWRDESRFDGLKLDWLSKPNYGKNNSEFVVKAGSTSPVVLSCSTSYLHNFFTWISSLEPPRIFVNDHLSTKTGVIDLSTNEFVFTVPEGAIILDIESGSSGSIAMLDLRKSTLTYYSAFDFPNKAKHWFLYKDKLSKEQKELALGRVEPLSVPLFDEALQIDPMLKMRWKGCWRRDAFCLYSPGYLAYFKVVNDSAAYPVWIVRIRTRTRRRRGKGEEQEQEQRQRQRNSSSKKKNTRSEDNILLKRFFCQYRCNPNERTLKVLDQSSYDCDSFLFVLEQTEKEGKVSHRVCNMMCKRSFRPTDDTPVTVKYYNVKNNTSTALIADLHPLFSSLSLDESSDLLGLVSCFSFSVAIFSTGMVLQHKSGRHGKVELKWNKRAYEFEIGRSGFPIVIAVKYLLQSNESSYLECYTISPSSLAPPPQMKLRTPIGKWSAMSFSENRLYFAAGTFDGEVSIFSLVSGTQIRKIVGLHSSLRITALEWITIREDTHSKKALMMLVSGGEDGTIRKTVLTSQPTFKPCGGEANVFGGAVSQDSTSIAVAFWSAICVYTRNGAEEFRVSLSQVTDHTAKLKEIRHLMQFSPNKKYLLLQFPKSPKLVGRILDLSTKEFLLIDYRKLRSAKESNDGSCSEVIFREFQNGIAESVFSSDSKCFVTLSKVVYSDNSFQPILSVWHVSGIELQRVTNFGSVSDFSIGGKLCIENHSVLIPGQMVEIDFRSSTAKCRMLSQEEFIDAKKQSVSSPNKEILQLPNGDSFRFAISGKGSEVTIEKIDPTSVSLPSPLLWVPYAKVLSVFTENGIVCAVDSLEHLHLMESPQFQKELPDSSAFSSLIFKNFLSLDESGVTALFNVCAQGTDSELGRNSNQVQRQVETLLGIGADVLHKTADGSTVLHAAASSDQLGVIEMIFRKLSQQLGWPMQRIITEFFNHQNKDGDTALHVACRACSKLAVEFLLTCGADLLIKNTKGTEPLMCLLESKDIISKDSCGRGYVNQNFVECGQFLLQYCSLDLAKRFQTALDEMHLAAIGRRHSSIIQYETYFNRARPLVKTTFQPFSLRKICARFYRRRMWLLEQLKQQLPEEMLSYIRSVDKPTDVVEEN